MTKRVNIFYMESTGAGHRRAAEAIADELRDRPGLRLELVNIVDHMNDTLNRVYQGLRNWLMEDAPHVFGQLYAWADRRPGEEESIFDRLQLRLELQSLRSLRRFMEETPCDLAIHTHFFPAEITSYLRRKGLAEFPHVTVTTDYFSHALWHQDPCELFFVASTDAARYLVALGVDPERVVESGIPIDEGFARVRPSTEKLAESSDRRCREFERGARPRILLTTTGVDPQTAARNLSDLLQAERASTVTVLAGGDAERKQRLEEVETPERHEVHILGPRDDMPQLLDGADIVIGKAGGLTCSEAMAVGCPLALLRPRPDQEAQNSDYLLEQQAAIRVFRSALLGAKMDELFGSPERWKHLRTHAHRLGRPDAAAEVARRSLQILGDTA